MLAHNLDFWLPAVTNVIQNALADFPLVDNGIESGPVRLIDGSSLAGAVTGNPRQGGDIWTGEDDAAEALDWTVEQADHAGQLRGILDAVRAHRSTPSTTSSPSCRSAPTATGSTFGSARCTAAT